MAKYVDEAGLTHFWDNIKSRLIAVNPDSFDGTDTENLQAAVTACVNGGTIILTHLFTLTADIDFKVNTNNAEITIIGFGNGSGIDFGSHCFYSSLATSSRSFSGVRLINCVLTGATAKCIDGDSMIRCAFSNCFIHDNVSVVTSTTYLQDYTFSQCKITSNTNVITAVKVFGGGFSQCTVENGGTFVVFMGDVDGFSISNCIIEGISNDAIQLTRPLAVTIQGCYFEAISTKDTGCVINLSQMSTGAIDIFGNYFVSASTDTTHTKVLVFIPVGINKYINMIGNRGGSGVEYLFDVIGTASTVGLRHLTYFGNSGFANPSTPNTAGEPLPLHGGDQWGCTACTGMDMTFYVAFDPTGEYATFPFDRHGASITLGRISLQGTGDLTTSNFTVVRVNSMLTQLQCTDSTTKAQIAGKVVRVHLTFSLNW